MIKLFLLLLLLHSIHNSYCFYLPGLSSTTYCKTEDKATYELSGKKCEDRVTVFVNKLDSIKTMLPYDYKRFDFCPLEESLTTSENLGEILFGERLHASSYKIEFLKPVIHEKLCDKVYETLDSKLIFLVKGVRKEYLQQWVVDSLPVTICYPKVVLAEDPTAQEFSVVQVDNETSCLPHFPIGCVSDENIPGMCSFKATSSDKVYIYNHIQLTIFYSQESSAGSKGYYIVKVQVSPVSCKDSSDFCTPESEPLELPSSTDEMVALGKLTISYTYSVVYKEDNSIKWASRWDYLLTSGRRQSQVQWVSLVNSVVIASFLSVLVAVILLRAIRRDLARYNKLTTGADELCEDYGWKLVHGDVFRAPKNSLLLSVLVGSGIQLVLMTGATLVFACMGFLSPANRGYLINAFVVSYILLGVIAGYCSARLYKMLGGLKWKLCLSVSAFLIPGVVFSIIFLLNLVFWLYRSSAALPFLTLLTILSLWVCISAPLTFLGGVVGYKQEALSIPVRVNKIPRVIPEQGLFSNFGFTIVIGGGLPFGCIFLQLFFIFNSIWAHTTYYYMFGFLFVVFLVLVIILMLNTVLLCYFHLCSEEYRWYWRAWMNSAALSIYVGMYASYYYLTKLQVTGLTSAVLYFSYTAIFMLIIALFSGGIGFVSCLWFVRKIYSIIKID